MAEGIQEQSILGDTGHHPQFHLRIVAAHEQIIPFSGHEHFPHPFPHFCPGGDVLEVGFRTGQPSGDRSHLVEMGVNPSGNRIDQGVEPQEIGRKQFGELPVGDQCLDDGMFPLEGFQYRYIGGISSLGLFDDGKSQFFKEQAAQLFGRIQVEFFPCLVPGLLFQGLDLLRHFFGDFIQHGLIDGNPGKFHIRQVSRQGQFDVFI